MGMHATIDPVKAVRWERNGAYRSIVANLVGAIVIVVAGIMGLGVLRQSKEDIVSVSADVVEVPATDSLSTIRYSDPKGSVHVKRIGLGSTSKGELVKIQLKADRYDEPLAADSVVRSLLDLVPWVVMLGGLVPLAAIPGLVVRLEKTGRAKKLLDTQPQRATFDWYRKEDGKRRLSVARVVPTENVWDEKTVQLGRQRLSIDPTLSYDVTVWGESRGTDPMVVVGDSWSYVVIR